MSMYKQLQMIKNSSKLLDSDIINLIENLKDNEQSNLKIE